MCTGEIVSENCVSSFLCIFHSRCSRHQQGKSDHFHASLRFMFIQHRSGWKIRFIETLFIATKSVATYSDPFVYACDSLQRQTGILKSLRESCFYMHFNEIGKWNETVNEERTVVWLGTGTAMHVKRTDANIIGSHWLLKEKEKEKMAAVATTTINRETKSCRETASLPHAYKSKYAAVRVVY